MSDEAHFHLFGFVGKQNFLYLSATNPTEHHEKHFTVLKSQYGARYLHLELSVPASLKMREKRL